MRDLRNARTKRTVESRTSSRRSSASPISVGLYDDDLETVAAQYANTAERRDATRPQKRKEMSVMPKATALSLFTCKATERVTYEEGLDLLRLGHNSSDKQGRFLADWQSRRVSQSTE